MINSTLINFYDINKEAVRNLDDAMNVQDDDDFRL